MPCFRPNGAIQQIEGERPYIFYDLLRQGHCPQEWLSVVSDLNPEAKVFLLPCLRCVGCRFESSRQWAVRCLHESSMHSQNSFITLTYNNSFLPSDGNLHYDDYQLFMKRLRKCFSGVTVRFFMCGEYGEKRGRPHFHALLFGLGFSDRRFFRKTVTGNFIYRSAVLERLWTKGYSSIGDVNHYTASYVSRYVLKKRYKGDDDYSKRVPEFVRMSLKPGIGSSWFDKYRSDIYPNDYVVIDEHKCKVPRFYDKLLDRFDPSLLASLKEKRVQRGIDFSFDSTRQRLYDREKFVLSYMKRLKRYVDDKD